MTSTDLGLISATHSTTRATDHEIGTAELYHHESVLRTSLGGAAAPPWLAAFANTLDHIQQTVKWIEQNEKHMSAVIENMRITKSNVELVRNTGITAYCAKQKEVHCVFRLSLVIMFILLFGQVNGNGTILSNTAVHNNNQIPLAPLAVAPAVGTIFSPTIETHNLNHPTILHIIQFYNQNFNIQPGNTVPIHVQKIVNWLTSEI